MEGTGAKSEIRKSKLENRTRAGNCCLDVCLQIAVERKGEEDCRYCLDLADMGRSVLRPYGRIWIGRGMGMLDCATLNFAMSLDGTVLVN